MCQHRVVHPNELEEASSTLLWVYDAVIQRVAALEGEVHHLRPFPAILKRDSVVVFKQQKQDVALQFGTFAHGMVSATTIDTTYIE